MLNKFKELFMPHELLKGNYGIEREGLRVNDQGELSLKEHPSVFGDKVENSYITTDFAESQIEVITPPFKNVEETYNFANSLYDIVAMEIGNEYLWPQSMPSIVPDDNKIKVAEYGKNHKGKEARLYREKLHLDNCSKTSAKHSLHISQNYPDIPSNRLYDCHSQLHREVMSGEKLTLSCRHFPRIRE